ncbi:MAG: 4-hydroxy-tetrahydrodipicolinate reductase [Planctomycetes bacterium]|nr:4-hydroxy-tetrahydrodipicolinate reductase [Planctomycetota bacterium]
MKPKLVVVGAAGRMGKRILSLAVEAGEFDIIAAVERQGHPDIGKDAGLLAAAGPINVELADVFMAAGGSQPPLATGVAGACVAVDFSQPEAAEKTVDYCLENSVALVSGTTGLSSQQREKIKAASEKIPIIYGTNMSVGMNVLFNLVGKVATMLGDEYDIEIVEQHHRFKKDAPSGSALTLAENICKATGRDIDGTLTHGRNGKDALRQKGTIGVHAIRAGDITGIHSVIFGTLGETVTLNHTANSRDTFARGALRAAKWLVGKEPALYSMADVLGI